VDQSSTVLQARQKRPRGIAPSASGIARVSQVLGGVVRQVAALAQSPQVVVSVVFWRVVEMGNRQDDAREADAFERRSLDFHALEAFEAAVALPAADGAVLDAAELTAMSGALEDALAD
jgi:hypothetical protein